MRATSGAELADCLIRVNADRGGVEVVRVPEDAATNPRGLKGSVGPSAAVADAARHATGQGLRDLPLRIDVPVAGA